MFLAADPAPSSSPLPMMVTLAALFGLMYFMFIRPQSKRRKEAAQMQQQLGVGDEVITIGGLYGSVVSMDDESVVLEISEGVTARYARQAVGRVVDRKAAPAEPITSPVDGGENS